MIGGDDMTREEYIYQLLKSNIIKYECVGSECSKDCIRVSSHIFHDKQAIVIWMPKMAWDNNEHILSKYIASYIGAGHHELILDACMTTDAFEDEFAIYNREQEGYYRDEFSDMPVFRCISEAYDYLCKLNATSVG